MNRYHIIYSFNDLYEQHLIEELCLEANTAEDALVFTRINYQDNYKNFHIIGIDNCPDTMWLEKNIIRHDLGIYDRREKKNDNK